MKKFTLFTLFAISLLLFGSGNIFAVPAVGDGTLGNPWQIANLADLQWLSTTTSQWVAGKYFEQTGDIDATGATPAITPIGITAASPFRGHYDGKGFTISNLTINNPSLKYRGLFGYTNAAIIQNLVLTDVNITGLGEVGGLVGYAVSSTITSCGVSGTVTAKETLTYNGTGKDAGGIAGFISTNSIVDKCWSSATIHAFQYAGGLIG